MKTTIFWFRRDLRLQDNIGLNEAISTSSNVLSIFIFDDNITNELPKNDHRVSFIYDALKSINDQLNKHQSSLCVLQGDPMSIWSDLIQKYDIDSVYTNKDYEPYARKRDEALKEFLSEKGIELHLLKDQVIHEESEVLKNDGTPYKELC